MPQALSPERNTISRLGSIRGITISVHDLGISPPTSPHPTFAVLLLFAPSSPLFIPYRYGRKPRGPPQPLCQPVIIVCHLQLVPRRSEAIQTPGC